MSETYLPANGTEGVLRLNRAGMIPIGEIDRAVASGI